MSNLEKTYSIPGVVRRRLAPDEWRTVSCLVKARELLIDAESEIRKRVNELEDENPTCKRCGQDSKDTKAASICSLRIDGAQKSVNRALDAFGAKHLAPWDLEDWPKKKASQDALYREIAKQDELRYLLKLEQEE